MVIGPAEIRKRARRLRERLESCAICPHACKANRLAGEKGKCGIGSEIAVSSFGPHFGEEAPLTGSGGSGTIFFTFCNLDCLFCQNFEISHLGEGETVPAERVARMMLSLQSQGCHNVNLVSPTHQIAGIVEALALAAEGGLKLPIVYNSGGFDSVPVLKELDGIMDIYMPDAKYADEGPAGELSGAETYPAANRAALREMHRQVGDLFMDDRGIALRGLLVRHLVLPNGLAGTRKVTDFIAKEISADTYFNVMDQYRPCFKAAGRKDVGRRPRPEEMETAFEEARAAGLHRFDEP